MIVLDTNILIHLLVKNNPYQKQVSQWFLANKQPLTTTHINVGETLRLLSHPRVFAKPLTLKQSIHHFQNFIDDNDIEVIPEDDNWIVRLEKLTSKLPSLRGNEVFDARIALCAEYHGIKKIATLDADFDKYSFVERVKIF